ncbi:MAG: glycosyl transferase family 1, partial [Desulfobacterium sp.]|nr:glycosyl transferase family 1 [Desulfobacterium sp.]
AYIRRIGILIQSRKYDLLWIEYELFPWLPAFAEKLLSLWNIPYIVDYDDAVFHRYDIHTMRLIRILLGQKIDRIMRNAALVLAGNSYLLERAKKAGADRIEYLPTVVDLERYSVREKHRSKPFNIGWIGSPSTSGYLQDLQPVLSELCEDQNTYVTLVGAAMDSIQGPRIRSFEWSEATEVKDIQQFDVGIMPLPDTLWAKGKCGYKLIQYMACGCPVVASSIGANREIVDNGKNGFLSTTLQEWRDNLIRLREDAGLRDRLGTNGRKMVEEKYCLQVTGPRLAALIQNLV